MASMTGVPDSWAEGWLPDEPGAGSVFTLVDDSGVYRLAAFPRLPARTTGTPSHNAARCSSSIESVGPATTRSGDAHHTEGRRNGSQDRLAEVEDTVGIAHVNLVLPTCTSNLSKRARQASRQVSRVSRVDHTVRTLQHAVGVDLSRVRGLTISLTTLMIRVAVLSSVGRVGAIGT